MVRGGLKVWATAAIAIAGAVMAASYAALPAVPARATPAVSPAVTKVAGGTATVALPAGVAPSYIWPFVAASNANEYNIEGFQMLMYRPLYMFGDNGSSVAVNYSLSTARPPVYSAGGKTVTISMKGWKWSDGESVDAKDIAFWLNMMKAERLNYYGYTPGLLPDNLASYAVTGPDTIVLHLKSAVSSLWFTYNQLAEITPMPLAWDVTRAGAAPGSGGCTTDGVKDQWAKCDAVYRFLSGQAQNVNTYATSRVWAVVDGPWRLRSFSDFGAVAFVPNPRYSGSPRPTLAKVEYVPYVDDTTEYTALQTRQLDVGYIPSGDLPRKPASRVLPATNPLGSGFTLAPGYQFGIQFSVINFNNPTFGPVFKQLYVRQALQEVTDQPGMINSSMRGYGYPTSGGVPSRPASQWLPAVQKANAGQGPYTFSVTRAKSLLTSHGWAAVGGVMTCKVAAKCGPGVKAGTKLSLTLDYASGIQTFQQEVTTYASDARRAGIRIKTVPQSFNTIIGESTPCRPGPKCTWQILSYGGWNFNGPGFEPTGEPLFQTGSPFNSGSFSDPVEDKLINETHTSGSLAVFLQYATYTARQLPLLWLPNEYAIQAVNRKLANVGFSPLADVLPEYWYFTK